MLRGPNGNNNTSEENASTREHPPTPIQVEQALTRIPTNLQLSEQLLRELESLSRIQFQELEDVINREFAEGAPITYSYDALDSGTTQSQIEHTPPMQNEFPQAPKPF